MAFSFKKDILPHLLGVLAFYLITVLYFSPIVFEGKLLFQSDILQWEGSAKEVLDYRNETGEETLWTNRMFGGMPAYLIHSNPKGDITNFLIKLLTLGLPHPIGSLFFGMVGMYILLLCFRIRPEISAAGAVAFAFNTFNILSLEAGHNAKIWAVCLIPLLFAGVHLAFTGKKLLGTLITAFAILLQLKFNHLQITYYTLIIVIIYGIGQLIHFQQKNELPAFGKVTGLLILGAFLGVLGNAARLTSVMEYSQYSTRGVSNLETPQQVGQSGLDKDYAFNWSQGKLESLTFLIPNFLGGGSVQPLPRSSASEEALRKQGIEPAQIAEFTRGAPTYWGDQPGTGGPIYGGVIMVFFFIIGLFFAPSLYRNIFLGITVATLILSWGKNLAWLNYFLFDYLPGYNKFRAVSMSLGITLFAFPVLGALGLQNLISLPPKKENFRRFWIATAVVLGMIALAVIIAGILGYRGTAEGSYPDWLQQALREDRKSMLLSDTFRSIAFLVVTAGLLFALLKQKLNQSLALSVMAVLVAIDVWGINRRYLNKDSFAENPSQQYFSATPADQKILQDPGHFRVLNLQNPFNEARTSYRFNSIGGYHGAKLGRYQELIENRISPEINQFIQKAQEGNFDFESIPVLNMLNTKYIMAGRAENAVFQNPQANGPAWFPAEIINVDTNQEEIDLLNGLDTKTKATFAIAQGSAPAIGSGSVTLKSYQPNQLTYSVEANKAGLVVFSEVYYPEGWTATINGTTAEILRTNYLLRGLEVPQGQSDVVFHFNPTTYATASLAMNITQYLLVLALGFALVVSIRRRSNQ
ncbi:YfhO family protein [Lunatimonas salinarum]|uniref:YfhO family protein n=1 Tax=Lunatimonas salinarum TaxID=1774590 RepID=UPI001ADF422D|nr:YfhO family protein [Lunatimonas salinarum]